MPQVGQCKRNCKSTSDSCLHQKLPERNSLMAVKNIFIIADPSNITKYKRRFKKL